MGEWVAERGNLKTLACGLLLLAPFVAAAQPRDPGFSISSQRVAQALGQAGVPVTPGQVRFLSKVSATSKDYGLQVINVAKWTGDTWKAELRCRDHGTCLPFYVLLSSRWAADTSGQTLAPETGTSPQGRDLLPIPAKQILMRDGDPATLVFESSTLRITVPVICLQSGNRGQRIRVVSTDHKRFFKAEIVEPGLLKATL